MKDALLFGVGISKDNAIPLEIPSEIQTKTIYRLKEHIREKELFALKSNAPVAAYSIIRDSDNTTLINATPLSTLNDGEYLKVQVTISGSH
jgi:hypothetical protein